MENFQFDYGKAEADLFNAGCQYSQDIYFYRTEKDLRRFLEENGLDPDRYFIRNDSSGSAGKNSKDTDAGGCFLTTACVRSKGLPDDCEELTILRHFRDSYLLSRENGRSDIAHYYSSAPKITIRINELPNAEQIWNELYDSLVVPCVHLIRQGRNDEAYTKYKSITEELENTFIRNDIET